jgi:hypothetical protein
MKHTGCIHSFCGTVKKPNSLNYYLTEMTPLKQFIEKYTDLSTGDWELIENSFERKEIMKDELILSEGEICRYFYFLEMGLVRFFIHHEGEDLTTYFVDAPYCFTAKENLNYEKHSK